MKVLICTFASIVLTQSLLSTECFSQDKFNGPVFGIGVGVAFSKHAGSYLIERDTLTGRGQFKDHPGIRLLAMDLRAGWRLKSFMLAYSLKITPPNNTVSPYRTVNHGINFNWIPPQLKKWTIGAGIGRVKVRDKLSKLGSGYLGELLLGFEADPRFQIVVSTLFGKINNKIEASYLERQLTTSKEFIIQITANYFLFRNLAKE